MGISELITHEDSFHVHKTFGLYVIIHYIYQFTCYFKYGYVNLHFLNILPHMLLHMTSFIFNVLQKRIMSKQMAMFIWEELRLHSMIFAYRACFCILFPQLRVPFIFFTMLCADITTHFHGNDGVSTVRGTHDRISSNIINK